MNITLHSLRHWTDSQQIRWTAEVHSPRVSFASRYPASLDKDPAATDSEKHQTQLQFEERASPEHDRWRTFAERFAAYSQASWQD